VSRIADPAARATERPGLVLAAGAAVVGVAAIVPAGIGGAPVPRGSVAVWALALLLSFGAQRACGVRPVDAAKRLTLFLPFILLLALPTALLAPAGRRLAAGLALLARATAATSASIALATWLGPSGLVAGLRTLHAPERLVQILADALASLAVILRQVRAMLRAREARRPGHGAWASLASSPVRTVRAFGRLVAALLLRSLERAEALERARRARGGEAS
jgi:energy-coupling factor transporter transmembrane protein EcfT